MVVTGDIHLKEDILMVEKDEAHTAPEEKVHQEVIHQAHIPQAVLQKGKANIQEQAVKAHMAVEEVIQAAGEAIVLAEDSGN